MLQVDLVTIRYGRIPAVRDISLRVAAGEIVGLIGPNGAGKSTTLNAIAGSARATAGSIRFDGVELSGLSPEQIAAKGLSLVPEGRQIFGTLTVEENIRLGLTLRKGDPSAEDDVAAVLERFPVLRKYLHRSAASLSGGEQQQLAIARALVTRPRLLMLDEPSLGLAPQLIELVFATLAELRDAGMTLLLVEQNVAYTIELADRIYVLRSGEITFSGTSQEATESEDITGDYLGAGTPAGVFEKKGGFSPDP